MVIPAIDLQNGSVVQLVGGERTALQRDLDLTLELFRGFPLLQVIDLDAAKGVGNNSALVRRCCAAGYRVRVGGGIRTVDRAREVLAWGAEAVIVSSAAFRDGRPDLPFVESLASDLGREQIIIAIDSRGAHVAIHGWREVLPILSTDAARELQPFCAEFLYTQIETEGRMQGLPLHWVEQIRNSTSNHLTVAGGIASLEEIERLEALDCNSVVGMAIYTGKIALAELLRFKVPR